jgi:hypothetical protein
MMWFCIPLLWAFGAAMGLLCTALKPVLVGAALQTTYLPARLRACCRRRPVRRPQTTAKLLAFGEGEGGGGGGGGEGGGKGGEGGGEGGGATMAARAARCKAWCLPLHSAFTIVYLFLFAALTALFVYGAATYFRGQNADWSIFDGIWFTFITCGAI